MDSHHPSSPVSCIPSHRHIQAEHIFHSLEIKILTCLFTMLPDILALHRLTRTSPFRGRSSGDCRRIWLVSLIRALCPENLSPAKWLRTLRSVTYHKFYSALSSPSSPLSSPPLSSLSFIIFFFSVHSSVKLFLISSSVINILLLLDKI